MTLVGISRQRSTDKKGWSSRSHRSGNSSHKRIVGMTSQIQLAFKMALSVLPSSPEKKHLRTLEPSRPVSPAVGHFMSELLIITGDWLVTFFTPMHQRRHSGRREAPWRPYGERRLPAVSQSAPRCFFCFRLVKRHHCRLLVTLRERRSSLKIPKFSPWSVRSWLCTYSIASNSLKSVHLCIFFPHKKFKRIIIRQNKWKQPKWFVYATNDNIPN